MFQAGDDHFVVNKTLDLICRRAKDCKSILMTDGMHELYLESDRVRDELLSKTAEYFNKF
jgi:alpha-beta hydrolase superfamily lysophospholipase